MPLFEELLESGFPFMFKKFNDVMLEKDLSEGARLLNAKTGYSKGLINKAIDKLKDNGKTVGWLK